ncbi:MAG: efflux RND transporter periplasmic adaptor subunit [Prevotella sp.]|jgi:HlyD family secretion protein|uniref:Efflux RND transporter periplasmic adaptor subunit n=1 Tax=Segatella cerevisiae TaxID=2053716 RepID=A0ABT1BYM0_9BACT|nr:HlyD family efflux transporter periplasmic adaptor subunit [Segatella cerevisiae]MCH3994176.1 efflux RND transporter periplasmic adaptor subunit [Prevotella sp.]MCI1247137.1 efflux RND transporter periplasmic adaptor subunit [Prevotella sp.]MCO6026187.1 efflux RND transporter periplasmic adaptor subunit [Segatella cerevisiae]
MSAKSQHNNIMLAALGFTLVVVVVGIIGFFTFGKQDDIIQGEVEVSEYRVSSKLPGRIIELRVKEGDYVHVGDTLAVLQVPEVSAQKQVAEATGQATQAMQDLTDAGARKQQIEAAYQGLQAAVSARTIAQKTYSRMQNLYNEGVIAGQKRDEALAAYQATKAQVKGAQAQYDLAKSGARSQEKQIAAHNTQAAQYAVKVVNSLLKETVQISTVEGEVSDVYPEVGELVTMGSPIMSINIMDDLWGDFNVREDHLKHLNLGQTFTAYVPAFDKYIKMRVYYIKDEGSYATWKATKTTGQYDLKTFEVKARPITQLEGLRPGMSLIIKKK